LKRPLQTSSSSRQDRWLSENRETISAQIRREIEQLDRGEGIPDNKLEAHLTRLKAKPEGSPVPQP
jgi:hypothetical protein